MWSGKRRAQASVELALITPIFMLMIAGTIEFGRTFFAYGQLLQATQEGARYGAVLRKSDSEITERVQRIAPGGAADTVTISTTKSPSSPAPVAAGSRTRGNVLKVAMVHPQQVLIPFLPLRSFTLTTSADMVIE
jgi:Flp pilus assembly protein TadG